MNAATEPEIQKEGRTMNALVATAPTNAEVYRASTDAAGLCREIVLKTAQNIQGRKYVKVEGWQAIAIAHGCTASAEAVERVYDAGGEGYRATGIVRRMSDGAEIARAEGFIGDDEQMWSKRPVYARRAMVQTRAISRACRSAFAHVVVLIDSNLSTTPAEEVPDEGFNDSPRQSSSNGGARQSQSGDVFPGDTSAPKLTLSERADAFLKDCEACKAIKELSILADARRAVELKRDLDRSDPELSAVVDKRVGELFDALSITATAAA